MQPRVYGYAFPPIPIIEETSKENQKMDWAKFATIIEAVLPGILFSVNPAFGFIASNIVALVKKVQTPNATGIDKLNAVVAGAGDVVSQINTAAGKVIVDPTLLTTDLPTGIALGIDIANKIGGKTPIVTITSGVLLPTLPAVHQ